MFAVMAIQPWPTKKVIKMKCDSGQCMAYNSGNKCAGCMKLFMAECCTGFDQEQEKCLLEAIPHEKRFYDMTAWHCQYIRSSVELNDFALLGVPACPFMKCFGVSGSRNKMKKPRFALMNNSLWVKEFHLGLGQYTLVVKEHHVFLEMYT